MLTGAAALATSSLAAGSASAKSGISGEDVPVPNVKGPIVGGEATGEPQTASVPDLSEYGYIEEYLPCFAFDWRRFQPFFQGHSVTLTGK